MSARVKPQAMLVLACAMVLLAVGCGGSSSSSSTAPDYAKALRGSPVPLANLHAQANQLLPGGKDAFEKRLKSLHGYPVVVNIWASWCGDCLSEFPMFQKLSARFGTRVAFIGIDSEDSEDTAAKWLAGASVPYPSYSDPDSELARSLKSIGLPTTVFFDRNGEQVWLKQGSYGSREELAAEIRKYALGTS